MDARPPLLVVGNSVRYLAQSAARSGYAVTGVDLFADADTQVACDVAIKAKQQSVSGLVQASLEARGADKTAWLYTAGFEAEPDLLQPLNRLGQCMGNSLQTLKLLGDPESLFSLLDELRIEYPLVRFCRPAMTAGWLVKNAGSCGGLGVHLAGSEKPSPARHYYQRYIPGKVCSVTFTANGRAIEILGMNQLFAVAPERGNFNYAGAISHFNPGTAASRQIRSVVLRLTRALQLRGANGIDFVIINGRALFLELNARPPATLELYEGNAGCSGINLHMAACRGVLEKPIVDGEVKGSQIVYAAHDLTLHKTDWPLWCSDIPSAKASVPKGAPICGLYATGPSASAVRLLLDLRLKQLRSLIKTTDREAA